MANKGLFSIHVQWNECLLNKEDDTGCLLRWATRKKNFFLYFGK